MGQLTTHVLDISAGLPASGVRIELHERTPEGLRLLTAAATGPDGRLATPLLAGAAFRAGSYLLTYRLKSGSSWGFVSTPVTVSGSSYTIAVSGQIDDVRFCPAAAQMTTYTFDPLIGMTSSTDMRGLALFYEYDSFGRLMNVRDQNGNLIKHLDYHYQGQ